MLHAEQAVFDLLRARVFGEAGDVIVIEERLALSLIHISEPTRPY